MTEGFIRLPEDGNGKRTRAVVNNISGNDVYQQIVTLADSEGNILTPGQWVSGLGFDEDTDVNYYYVGFIKVGSNEWRIKRISKTNYDIRWASGLNDAETNWSNRVGLTYNINL